jgi:ABC-type dipeptide/oligopeptide/nickel transport system ATPase component
MAINHEFIVPKSRPLPKRLEGDPLGTPSMTMIIGGTGSGKSTAMANVLMALERRHDFDSGLFVTSNGRDPILESIELPITQSPGELDEYITKTRQAKEGTNHILILDDCQGSPDFKIMTNRSRFVEFMLSHRHFGESKKNPGRNGVWVIMTCQTLRNSFTPQVRDQVKNFILYYPRSNIPNTLKSYEELVNDPTAMKRAMSLVKAEGRHAFLFLNKHDPANDRYFIGFDKEILDLN